MLLKKILASVYLLLNGCVFTGNGRNTLSKILMQISMSSVLQKIRILFC